MAFVSMNLVVIRAADLDRSEAFYSALGLTFTRHRHGDGPLHCAAEIFDGQSPPLVFEIYPAKENVDRRDAVRLGFCVADIDAAMEALIAAGGKIVSKAKDSEWGRRAVVADPDGHRVELTMSSSV